MVRGDPVCRKEDFSQYDIGLFFKEISSYSDQHKLKFIENVLAYSKYLDGAFCLPCVLFGVQCGRNSNKLEKLYKSPLTLWMSAISRFTKHVSGKCEMHNFAVIAMENFLKNMTRESVAIGQQINNLLEQQIKRNREVLKSLFRTILFGGKNNIALRGPRDDDPQIKCQSFWKLSGTVTVWKNAFINRMSMWFSPTERKRPSQEKLQDININISSTSYRRNSSASEFRESHSQGKEHKWFSFMVCFLRKILFANT